MLKSSLAILCCATLSSAAFAADLSTKHKLKRRDCNPPNHLCSYYIYSPICCTSEFCNRFPSIATTWRAYLNRYLQLARRVNSFFTESTSGFHGSLQANHIFHRYSL
jgi:hypothetical protein